ncbi:MAG: hypothetical protein JRN52_02030 [Nitrososphaerota archaeon]|nr:hypothetical protein [Nitrososphaerota archaeon]
MSSPDRIIMKTTRRRSPATSGVSKKLLMFKGYGKEFKKVSVGISKRNPKKYSVALLV